MRSIITAFLALGILISGVIGAFSQSSPAPTNPIPVVIATGNTYQLLQAAGTSRRSLTIQNNNATADNCFLLIGGPWQAGDTTATTRSVNGATISAAAGSVLLQPGVAYTRYMPYVPSDQLLVTCATSTNSVYADIQ